MAPLKGLSFLVSSADNLSRSIWMYRVLQIPKSPISSYNYRTSFPFEIHGAFHHQKENKPDLDAFLSPLSSSIKSCKGIGISVANNLPKSTVFIRGGEEERQRGQVKIVDVATLGNLCVDVVLNVPSLPPASLDERKAYMERLADSRPDKVFLGFPFFFFFFLLLGFLGFKDDGFLVSISCFSLLGFFSGQFSNN